MSRNGHLLQDALECAVPLWIEELRGRSHLHRRARAHHCAQVVANHGDIILYASKTKGETANAFNRLAEGIACAAFQPGGIRAFDLLFCAQHPNAKADPAGSQICPACLEEAA